jgi:glycosyltransferase involved in cell wall biosynthesis
VKPRLCVFFPSLETGGLERAVMRITAALVDRGLDVEVVSVSANAHGEEHWDPRVARTLFKPVPGIGAAGRGRSALSLAMRLLIHWTRRRPDCVLTVQSSTLCIPLSLLFGIPVIHRESSNSLQAMGRHKGVWKRRVVLGAKAVVYRACAFVVANASGAADSARQLTGLPAARVRVLPNPVDALALSRTAAEPAEDDVAAAWLADSSLHVIVWVGRLSWEKDGATMVRAFARLVAPSPYALASDVLTSARLVIAGDGRELRDLERLAETLGVSSRIRFCGHVRNPAALMARARVYALTSLYEGLPNALLEAAALGVPSVSTDCPTGPREILAGGQGGWLVPIGDEAALSEALALMLTDRSAAVARARVALDGLSRYHPATVGEGYARLILSAIGGADYK